MSDVLNKALNLQAGLKAWVASDRYLDDSEPAGKSKLRKVFRDNWDYRIGTEKFGGVWSIDKAKTNHLHPASTEALKIDRTVWTGKIVTVDHAIPVNVLFSHFWDAETPSDMQEVIDAYAVAVVTKQEDELLSILGLKAKMPDGWRFGDDPLVRWKKACIEVHMEIPVEASIVPMSKPKTFAPKQAPSAAQRNSANEIPLDASIITIKITRAVLEERMSDVYETVRRRWVMGPESLVKVNSTPHHVLAILEKECIAVYAVGPGEWKPDPELVNGRRRYYFTGERANEEVWAKYVGKRYSDGSQWPVRLHGF